MSWFSWLGGSSATTDLPEIYPLSIVENSFVDNDVQNIYARILTDVFERTEGIAKENQALLWDNCSANESQDGLVTMLAKAMTQKTDLFLVYKSELKIIVKADDKEAEEIRADYKKQGKSAKGVFITFKNYSRTDLVKLYSALEYATIAALSKSMNLSKAVQIKISKMRETVAAADSASAIAQAKAIADALGAGKDVVLDGLDTIENSKPDLTATTASMDFIAQKQSFYLSLPASYIKGEGSSGLGDKSKADSRAVERGLRPYFFSIVKPVIKAIFNSDVTFKSEDFDMLSSALEALKVMELTSEELISMPNKQKLINKLFGYPAEEKGEKPDEKDVTDSDPNANPANNASKPNSLQKKPAE